MGGLWRCFTHMTGLVVSPFPRLWSSRSNKTRKPPVRPHNFLGILKEYKFRPPLNFTFNWEDQQGH